MNKEALKSLGQHTGTTQYTRYSPLFALLLTDGALALAKHADAFWFMDLIGSHQPTCKKDESLQGMQFWHLVKATPEMLNQPLRGIKTKGGIKHYHRCEEGEPMAYAICERDTGDAAIVQEIPFTDFPFDVLPKPEVWAAPTEINGKLVMIAYLPSEH